jgi:hypothetical protein
MTIRTPAAGDEIASPVRIAGTTGGSLATVAIRILDADGSELAGIAASPACGAGCRGRFSAVLAFFTERRQAGTIEVFQPGTGQGSVVHTLPVVLVPGP